MTVTMFNAGMESCSEEETDSFFLVVKKTLSSKRLQPQLTIS